MTPELPVLLVAPTRRDARYSRTVLSEAGIAHAVCTDLNDLIDRIGDDTGAVILSENALTSPAMARLADLVAAQPPWSDLPFVILTGGGADSPMARRALETLSNVALLERPVRVATLVSVLRTSLRARERQRQIREHLDEVERLNGQLEQLAFYDSLTGLPNRVLLHDRLTQAMARARRDDRPCGVLFLDFDDFKVINDSLGHDFGDRALQVVADRLRDTLREEDTAARLGVCLAIDDFGTGYSSLGYLQRLPVDAIKIDRGFVSGAGGNAPTRNDRTIVEAIVSLGRGLGIRVVGEGIETTAQRDLLRALGCDEGQGFLFGEPQPPVDAERALRRSLAVGRPEPC